jgi:F-type H+-transporting ATPase subunit b
MADSSPANDVKTTGTTHPSEGGAGGLPQFDLAWWPGQMVWFLIVFAVLFALMAKVFVPRVGGTIAEREDRISGDIAQARALKEQAEAQAAQAEAEMAQARSRSAKLASDAKARAQAEANQRQTAEEAKLGESVAKAEAEIRAARDQAMSHVRDIAADTVQAIVVKLTGAAPSSADVQAALADRN